MTTIEEILKSGTLKEKKALFQFNKNTSDERVILKFNLWARHFFAKYFTSPDCDDHAKMDLNNLKAYRGEIKQYVNVAYRGFSKTARTKLFIAFCVANDADNTRRYIRCLCADMKNAKQSVTDIYNMLIQPRVKEMYPEIFERSELKREETMEGFTTATSIKILAKQIGVDQRGNIMEDAKTDFDWYDDIETKTTIRSALITHKIKENMEEARTGLALNGSSIYTCNYFSEQGNVHDLIINKSINKVVQITPIMNNPVMSVLEDGKTHIIDGDIRWSRYTIKDIDGFYQDDEDFWGERMCKPDASKDIYFDREALEKMPIRQPIKDIGGFKIFKDYNPSHRYAGGHDIAGGVGLDSSTSVFIDFSCMPAQVVGTYASNTILPEAFGDEIVSQANRFGGCLICPENNKFDQTILKARQLGGKLWMSMGKAIKIIATTPTTYGWNTNSLSKSNMLSSLREAIESGLIELNDENLINEAKSYTRNDLIDNPIDVRLTTRHFDGLMALAICWAMRDHTRPAKPMSEEWDTPMKESNPAI